jgi:pyrroline-5-carboxylate reductase
MEVGFIGGGNMAEAILGGLSARYPKLTFKVIEPHLPQAEKLQQRFSASTVSIVSGEMALQSCDVVFLAVKPQVVADVLPRLQLAPDALAISIAAGVTLRTLQRLQPKVSWLRTMPNTPALVGQGVTALYATPAVRPEQRRLAQGWLEAVGTVVWVSDEADLDAVTALSGSGPAYFFRLVESLARAGEALGLSPEVAAALAKQTFLGSATLAAHSADSISTLRSNVTSKGGTTEAALNVLNAQGLDDLFQQALIAAKQRAQVLGQNMEQNTEKAT